MSLRDNWRLILLAALLVTSTFALFGPGVGTGDAEIAPSAGQVTTNLAYGIQLDGGTRLRAPVAGWTAENVTADPGNVTAIVAAELNLDQIDVASVQTGSGPGVAVEIRARNVTRAEAAAAFAAAGVDVNSSAVTLRQGVTKPTRQEMVSVINAKISESGLSGGSVHIASTVGGQNYIVVEAPNRGADELERLLRERGVVTIDAFYPTNGNHTRETVLRKSDLADIGAPQTAQGGDGAVVPLTVKDSEAERFAQDMVDAGFVPANADTIAGGQRYISCDYESRSGRCLLVVSDEEVVSSFGMYASLAESFQNGDFARDPTFQMQVENMSEARTLAVNLRAGALPAPLDFAERDLFTIEPALAQQFKLYSLVTGILAVLAVSLVVFLRYGDVRVAAPMVVTALSEVVLLLGFAAAIKYPLDLSVIAGFIAVIGTGVDDLVIIADEVMSEGDVSSSRVFQSRFRKALWVIGAAAATTILAMSPLAFLSLGDLQGFAIVTILGVLIGVLITRPAYGDVLRMLLTDR
ncbi:MAG: preprotein translocase subunit SecD [Halobacteriaceae archaeon]